MAFEPIGDLSYSSYAFFATKEYLKKNPNYLYEFIIEKVNDTYIITNGVNWNSQPFVGFNN